MSDTVIKVENLGKKYIIKHNQEQRYTALRDIMVQKVKSIGKKKVDTGQLEEFWALRDINFEIKQGARVGIIGRNGAGKSTLLKLLSQITEPTTGRISIKGRVSSLLEVGTGFHPELTGRENIYLNGAILGMGKSEIKRKFDEIVEFAEVEKFLDTPVKRYSSGMYMRLAFSVSANLEPDILIVDEVLAVGDVQFQKKCLGKMEDVGKQGTTVIFVSHNMEAIQKLCSSGIILKKGQLANYCSDTRSLISEYTKSDREDNVNLSQWVNNSEKRLENEYFIPHKVSIVNNDNETSSMPLSGMDEAYLQIEAEVKQSHPGLIIGYVLYNPSGIEIYCGLTTDLEEDMWPRLEKGKIILQTKLPIGILQEGEYRIELQAVIHLTQYLVQPSKNAPCIYMTIQGSNSKSPIIVPNRSGLLRPVIKWNSIKIK